MDSRKDVQDHRLISLITIRLELKQGVSQLKYFKEYTAKSTFSSKTYASVTKLGIEKHSESGEQNSRLRQCDIQPYDNPTCQGERQAREITIEVLDGKEWQNILMQREIEETAARHTLTDIPDQEKDPSIHLMEEPMTTSMATEITLLEESCAIPHRESSVVKPRERSLSGSDMRPGTSASFVSRQSSSMSPHAQMPSSVNFFCGNPSVELTKGILHIYKDSQMTPLDKDTPRSEVLCMLGVPASYTIHDLIQFIAPMGEYVAYMQVLRDAFPNQYLLLVKFRDQESADDFYSYFNNRPFNSIEPDICHLVYVTKIEVISETEGGSMPVMGLTELPNCPVCLEKMEESVDGVLTILCTHSFHTACLAQWGDTSCPVCRYIQTPEVVEDQRCMQCGSHDSLWICLICGNVGCGRYVGLHAYKHFQATNHTYSMQLGTNRVWDYAGDNYVHRLAQNKSDGKLVQLDEGGREMREEKIDSLTLEYTYLLTTQLESQRQYFMEEIAKAVQDVEGKLEESNQRLENEIKDRERAEDKLAVVTKEKQTVERKFNQLHSRTSKVLTELQEERQMNVCLRENQQQWQVKVNQLEEQMKEQTARRDQEVQDLQDQLRDVMFYLEAQSKEELKGGQVTLGASPDPQGGSGRRGKRKPTH